jgi:hypothetical protein
MLAKELGFTLAELAELEEPKRKRAPSTTIYRHPENPRTREPENPRTRPSPGPVGVTSRAGLPPMSMPAQTRTNCSAEPEERRAVGLPPKICLPRFKELLTTRRRSVYFIPADGQPKCLKA